MAVDEWSPDAWMVVHPGFSRNPADYEYQPYQMSYEFAKFMADWDLGDFGPSEFHTRNVIIARRKSCFPEPLMNGLGVFTKAGELVLARAKSYIAQMRRYYQSIDQRMPEWQDTDRMDTIVLAAVIETKHIIFLKSLYNETFQSNSLLPVQFRAKTPMDLDLEFREYNGRVYMMTGMLRNFPQRRVAFEVLVKLGLIGIDSLPKPLEARGRGRAPVGGYLTERGKKFYEDYQQNYDPQVKKRVQAIKDQQGEY